MKIQMKIVLGLVVAAAVSLGAGNAKDGKESYDKACKSCHGVDGAPNAGSAKMMKVEMKHLGSAEVQGSGDAKLTDAVKKGVGKMKPVSTLNDKQIGDVVAYVKTLKK